MDYKTCTHIYDDGHACNSAATKDRDPCTYTLRYRARFLLMAQNRARGERLDLRLLPLESMHAVQVALTQLAGSRRQASLFARIFRLFRNGPVKFPNREPTLIFLK